GGPVARLGTVERKRDPVLGLQGNVGLHSVPLVRSNPRVLRGVYLVQVHTAGLRDDVRAVQDRRYGAIDVQPMRVTACDPQAVLELLNAVFESVRIDFRVRYLANRRVSRCLKFVIQRTNDDNLHREDLPMSLPQTFIDALLSRSMGVADSEVSSAR